MSVSTLEAFIAASNEGEKVCKRCKAKLTMKGLCTPERGA